MAEPTLNQYGRRSWNKEEYAKAALDRKRKLKEAKLNPPKDRDIDDYIKERKEILLKADTLNRISLISADQATVSKRGKNAGFYCEYCNLTYKDNLQFIDHLNSKPHLVKAGFGTNNNSSKEITLEMIKQRIEQLNIKRSENMFESEDVQLNVREMIAKRKALEEEETKRKKERRRIKRQKKAQEVEHVFGFKSTKQT
ncbi:U4/U6.U5 snRNP component [Komagataella phaffii CBS 7435]|uniref:Component of U4/U6.U5 snRNP involved in mRNA splicing via spliceosome n=2 Tax=Komagataella phaffii TaxID=460519 RepID=C4QWY7_KOMPG|nr:Component of U4/U6.U5 snRNP involved in mRNA splicing via spliceosome [Komagataella phaffii GS115]AOA61460.1 GQ67_02969T0 [Komagataella phaffii]CAH2446555.1 U4/U6.U5 snRNP component [Komagataella phaffii CBS 7435]AOA65931.1 GQ68_02278T0 [Komagataella phaffii GS115]CAY67760.1 Component of U4/U6.U5 snRNP involved in mRNA splicing via spliceosome [Komagataella phaffii GS115]CCA36845.1 U4/U6.U5 snRNP component [Komagataella phaffii CBS 7435]